MTESDKLYINIEKAIQEMRNHGLVPAKLILNENTSKKLCIYEESTLVEFMGLRDVIENAVEDGQFLIKGDEIKLEWDNKDVGKITYLPMPSKQQKALNLSAALWNSYLEISQDEKHPDDNNDVRFHIHAIQNILYTQMYKNQNKEPK